VQPNHYVVRDADGQQIAYVYYSNDPERRSAAKLLTKDEARRIAANKPSCRSWFVGKITYCGRSQIFVSKTQESARSDNEEWCRLDLLAITG
jgi:hypothetical protein